MLPSQRRQLPRQLFNLTLRVNASDGILVYRYPARPTYTPFFDKNDNLVGVFLSTVDEMVACRVRVENTMPCDKIFVDVNMVLKWARKKNLVQELINLNNVSGHLIDPDRDPSPFWEKKIWPRDPLYSSIDYWALKTKERIHMLKNGTARTLFDGDCNMAMIGVMLAMEDFTAFDSLIQQEADAYARMPFNYAWQFETVLVHDIDYPFKDHLKENVVVRVKVPEFLHLLDKPPPFFRGVTYIDYTLFKPTARKLFMLGWKRFAASLSNLVSSPQFSEFLTLIKLPLFREAKVQFSPSTPSEILQPDATVPPCLISLFAVKPFKHYARWQLACLAVDLKWPEHILARELAGQSATVVGEVVKHYRSYKQRPTLKARCRVYMHSGLCPYTARTCSQCTGQDQDIENMTPAGNFLLRRNKKLT